MQAREEPGEAVTYVNATVVTLEPSSPRAAGLCLEGGRVVELFGKRPRAARGRIVDLEGAVVLPGLADGHLHLSALGQRELELDLQDTGSLEEALARVGAHAAGIPKNGWVVGRGWDQERWGLSRYPRHEELEVAGGGRAVWLTRVDGHAGWASSSALAKAGIDPNTADPQGGEILRDATKRPTGVLIDAAMELVSRHLPSCGSGTLREALRRGLAACRQHGLTSLYDLQMRPAVLSELVALAAEGELTARIGSYLHVPAVDLTQYKPGKVADGVRILGLKLFIDGALGSHGAALLAPYADRPDARGLLVWPQEELLRQASRGHARGFQLALHAIGDRACKIALDAIAQLAGGVGPRRHRIEHAQLLRQQDVARFARLGVVASMQPRHATSDMQWLAARIGPHRLAGAYAWRSLLDAGAVLAFGSDAPVESVDPWQGIQAAVTRQTAQGDPPGGWLPEQRLSLDEALRAYTEGVAYAGHADGSGRIRVGAPADLSVVDRDPYALAPSELTQVRTLRTIVGGREVYRH